MAVIKCKMCGGDMELSPDKTYGTCEYCGSTMTLPKIDDDQRAVMFNRGNHFRRIGEFDKAMAVYERIVQEDDADAEAHWCCALCRFGIEYVEDPETYDWVPTCHRASFDNFLEDVDYLAAVNYSDGVTRRQYQKEAARIAEVQRGILATSQNEDPFDIFICYKESDENDNRTVDSTLAQEIYYELIEQGRRVFFARITLEDKAGSQYEPYIFAALNSAKVMIAIGTKPEHFNAVWVKNEWSRYLALMKKDRKRLLIPCYRDMDPYDLPEQLSALQSYDMGKIGFIQDLIRGVSKVLDADKPASAPARETVVVQGEGGNLNALLKRGNIALEDGEWKKADEFFEQSLNLDAECAEAYFGKALAAGQCHSAEELVQMRRQLGELERETKMIFQADDSRIAAVAEQYRIPGYLDDETILQQFEGFDLTYESVLGALQGRVKAEEEYFVHDKLMSRAVRYAKGDLSDMLQKIKADICSSLQESLNQAKEEEQKTIRSLADQYAAHLNKAEEEITRLRGEAEQKREEDYARACADMEKAHSEQDFIWAAEQFKHFEDYRDSGTRMEQCRKEADRLAQEYQARQEAERKKRAASERRKDVVTKIVMAVAMVSAIAIFVLGKEGMIPGIQFSDKMVETSMSTEYGEYDKKPIEPPLNLQIETVAHHTISAGTTHTVCLQEGGTVVATGTNHAGESQLGAWSDIIDISAGCLHTVGLKSDGTVVAMGDSASGQCKVYGWSDIVAVSAGYAFTIGLKSDGTAVSAGYGSKRCKVDLWSHIVAVSAGGFHVAGLKSDGTVVALGSNAFGECDVNDWSDITAIAAGYRHTVGLKQDGTVVATGSNDYGQCNVSDWSDIIAIAAGETHTAGLRSDGTVVCAGANDAGECNVDDWSDIVSISAGTYYTVGLKSDGSMVAVGLNADHQCDVGDWLNIKVPESQAEDMPLPENSTEAEKEKPVLQNEIALPETVSAGYDHTVGLKTDGTVVATGSNDYGQCNVNGWTDIIAVAAGDEHTVGLKTDGTVIATGRNDDGQCEIGNWTDIVAISAGCSHTVGLKSDGTVVAVGFRNNGRCNVDDWTDIVAVSAGYGHTVGLKSDGTVVAVGYNNNGRCDVDDWTDIVAVSAGYSYTIGLKSDGTAIGIGDIFYGKCDVDDWTDIVAVSTGYDHAVGLKSNGTVIGIGNNFYGKCDVDDWTDIVAVSAEDSHTVGLKSDGTVIGIGDNFHGECDVDDWTDIKMPEH